MLILRGRITNHNYNSLVFHYYKQNPRGYGSYGRMYGWRRRNVRSERAMKLDVASLLVARNGRNRPLPRCEKSARSSFEARESDSSALFDLSGVIDARGDSVSAATEEAIPPASFVDGDSRRDRPPSGKEPHRLQITSALSRHRVRLTRDREVMGEAGASMTQNRVNGVSHEQQSANPSASRITAIAAEGAIDSG